MAVTFPVGMGLIAELLVSIKRIEVRLNSYDKINFVLFKRLILWYYLGFSFARRKGCTIDTPNENHKWL